MKYPKITIFFLAAAMSTSTLLVANDDDDEEPFDEAFLFFELNDTDGDLGIHGKIDGGPWKKMKIEGPNERTLLKARARGRLARQGMTELFFESAEPCFPTDPECEDPLDPEDFFSRFPEGEYEIEGLTLDYEELENEVYLSHVIPAAPDVKLNGADSASREECQCDPDEEVCEALPTVSAAGPAILSWSPVTTSHATLGESGVIEVRYYEVVAEIDETDFKSTAIVPPGTSSWEIPAGILGLSDTIKYEVLVRVNVYDDEGNPVIIDIDGEEGPLPGNKSAMESCFAVEE